MVLKHDLDNVLRRKAKKREDLISTLLKRGR